MIRHVKSTSLPAQRPDWTSRCSVHEYRARLGPAQRRSFLAVNTRRLSIGLLVLFAFAAAGALPARAQAGWLDVPLTQWNRAGTALPAPPPVNASGNDTRCADEQRPPETP